MQLIWRLRLKTNLSVSTPSSLPSQSSKNRVAHKLKFTNIRIKVGGNWMSCVTTVCNPIRQLHSERSLIHSTISVATNPDGTTGWNRRNRKLDSTHDLSHGVNVSSPVVKGWRRSLQLTRMNWCTFSEKIVATTTIKTLSMSCRFRWSPPQCPTSHANVPQRGVGRIVLCGLC